jgi:hypothetical protein
VAQTCQPGVTLGNPQMIVVDRSGAFGSANGLCFPRCSTGALNSCDDFPGTVCAQTNQAVVGAAWNGIAQCLPPALAFGQ